MKYQVEKISECTLVPEGNVYFIKAKPMEDENAKSVFFILSSQDEVQDVMDDCKAQSFWEPYFSFPFTDAAIVNIYGHFTSVQKTSEFERRIEYGPEPLSFLLRVFDNDFLMKTFNCIVLNSMVISGHIDDNSCLYVMNKKDKSFHIKPKSLVSDEEIIFYPYIEIGTFINLITEKYDDGSYVDFIEGLIDEDPSLDEEYILSTNYKIHWRDLAGIAKDVFWFKYENDLREYTQRMNEIKKDIAEVYLTQSNIL